MKNPSVLVTRPSLPPLEDVIPLLERIWVNKILTNQGPLHDEFGDALRSFLGIEQVSLVGNGTLGLMLAIRALGLTGEVITTPYTFVATAHALAWSGLKPRFVDIDARSLNIDPKCIEDEISSETSAILGVHCYGNPCNVEAIEEIACRNGVKVLYDAAHAFGVTVRGNSILNHGDASVLSFHATKVFTTFEGGAVVSADVRTRMQIDSLRNFGIEDEITVPEIGINAKLNEFGAAIGLAQLPYFHDQVWRRSRVDGLYRELLQPIAGIRCVEIMEGVRANYAYFPVLVEDVFPLSRDKLFHRLRERGVMARRYFYPLIADLPVYRALLNEQFDGRLLVARRVANQVICLPIYPELPLQDVERIVDVIKET